jgi:hypothetical protein
MDAPDQYFLRFVIRLHLPVREGAAKFCPRGYLMSPFVKAKLALFALVLLAVATMSAQTLSTATKSGGGTTGTPPIVYNGGPVMTGNPVNVYLIWYGNWNASGSDTPATQSLVQHFLSTFGGTPLAQVNTLYSDSTGAVSGNFMLGGPGGTPAVQQSFSSTYNTSTGTTNAISAAATFYPNSTGSTGTTTSSTSTKTSTKNNLTDGGVQKIVENALNNGQLPRDPNGVYFVLSSSDINESTGGGFCGAPSTNPHKTGFCGWHTHASMGGVDIKFAFVGNPDRCEQLDTMGPQCEFQTTGPNTSSIPTQNADGTWTYYGGGDGMVNIIMHELSEAATDPDQNAWYNSNGDENGDVCLTNIEPHQLCGPGVAGCSSAAAYMGSDYNQTFGGNIWLLQELAKPNSSFPAGCVQHL